MEMQPFETGPCHVDRERGVSGYSFAICAPYRDGLPGSAVLACAAYGPHAQLFAAADPMLRALVVAERFMSGFEGDEQQGGIDEMLTEIRAAIASATGGEG